MGTKFSMGVHTQPLSKTATALYPVWILIVQLLSGHIRAHPPPPDLPFPLTQNMSPRDIARSDIMKLKVSSNLHMATYILESINFQAIASISMYFHSLTYSLSYTQCARVHPPHTHTPHTHTHTHTHPPSPSTAPLLSISHVSDIHFHPSVGRQSWMVRKLAYSFNSPPRWIDDCTSVCMGGFREWEVNVFQEKVIHAQCI